MLIQIQTITYIHPTYKTPGMLYKMMIHYIINVSMIIWAGRQLGFSDRRLCPQLNRLASDYIQKRDGWEDTAYSFFAHDPDCDSLFIKLVEEFERCILSYFAFHWSYAETALKQVKSIEFFLL